MPTPEGTAESFGTDPHLNESINDVLSGFQEDAPTGASESPSQDGRGSVESSETPAAPSPGDRGEGFDTPPSSPPQSPGDTPPSEPEPQTEPFSYTVSGEARSIGEFFRIPGEGVFVPEAQVPRLQQIASRADANEATLRELHDRNQTWDRLTQWTVPGPNGQPQVLSGQPAYEAQRVALDQLAAVVQTYQSYISDPQKLASLLVYDQQTGAFSIDPEKQRLLSYETKDAAREAEQRIRSWIQQQGGGRVSAPSAAPEPAVPVTEQIKGNEAPIVTAKLQEWGVRGLTKEDVDTLARQLPRYVRGATREDVQANPALKLGQPVLENEYETMVRQFAASRATGATSAQATAVANKFNGGQQRGRAGQRPAAPPPAPVAPPQDTRNKRGRQRAERGDPWATILERGLNDADIQATLAGQQ